MWGVGGGGYRLTHGLLGQGKNSWQRAKHVWLYCDIISPRFSAEGTLISA